MTNGATPAAVTYYDVDSVADVKKLISIDPLIVDGDTVLNKMTTLDNTDLVLVKKVRTGAIKIVDVTKIDSSYISKYLK